jgi:hypothetical protein
MRPLYCVLAGLVFAVALTSSASAAIVVDIDRSVQRMAVTVDGVSRYNWGVSTARRGYITPPGTYHPEMLARHWFSRKYYNSPMPRAAGMVHPNGPCPEVAGPMTSSASLRGDGALTLRSARRLPGLAR